MKVLAEFLLKASKTLRKQEKCNVRQLVIQLSPKKLSNSLLDSYSNKKMKDKYKPSILKNFALGGISGMIATSCIQPLDYVKVQLQV